MKLNNKTILIVGASVGIGRSLALELARRDNNIIITARNREALEKTQREIIALGSRCDVFAADAHDEDKAAAIVAETAKKYGKIDAGIINVGGAWPIVLPESSAKETKEIFTWNMFTVINYFMPLMQHMKDSGGGVIAQTNSLAGFQGLPFTAAYAGAKSAMRIFFDGARVELRDYGIKLVTLCPGFVSTRAHEKGEAPTPFIITPEKAARKMLKAIEKEKRTKLFPFPLAIGTRLGTMVPAFITDFIFSKQKLKETG